MSGNGLSSMRRSTSQSQKMDMPKLQPRIGTFPPPHKTQLPPRYQVTPGPWRPTCRRNTWLFLGILMLLSFCIYVFSVTRGVPTSSNLRRTGGINKKGYAIIIDAGSTGSRLHVFQYVNGKEPFYLPLVNSKDSPSIKKRPGLSSFSTSPNLAGKSLEALLDFARDHVPEGDRDETRLYLMATAGLRLLSKAIQIDILDSCRAILRDSGFAFKDEWASVITGTDEGIFAWIAANYALGSLGFDPHETTGIVELGGASAQVTFVPKDVPPPAFRHDLVLVGVHYSLYTYSFLEFGQEAAKESMLGMITSGKLKPALPVLEHGVLVDPCTPRGFLGTQDNDKRDANTGLSIKSAGNFTECRAAALTLLHKDRDSCVYKKCAIGTAFVPELRGNFFATENFFYTSEFFGLPSSTSLADVEAAGQHYCGLDWDALQQKHKGMETDDLLKYCFSTAYIVALLHDTLGVDMHDDRVRFTNRVGDTPLDWALGALIFHMNGENAGDDSQLWVFGDGSFKVISVFGGLVLLALLVSLVIRYRKPHLKTIYDLEKGRYITTPTRSTR